MVNTSLLILNSRQQVLETRFVTQTWISGWFRDRVLQDLPKKLNTKLYASSFWFYFHAIWDTYATPLPTTPKVFKSDKSRDRKHIHTLDQYCSYYVFNYIWTPSETKRNIIWINDAKSTHQERGKNLCMSVPGKSESKATGSLQEVTRVVLSRSDVK